MKKKVLHVIGYLGKGGDTTAVLNIMNYHEYDKNIKFDFVTHNGYNEHTLNVLKNKESNIYIIDGDVRKIGIIKYYIELQKILKNNQYDAIHFHTSFQSCVGLICSYFCGIKKRICHSHTTQIQRSTNIIAQKFVLPFCRFLINAFATKKIACSVNAGEFLFGKNGKFNVIYNGLEIEKLHEINKIKVKEIKFKYNIDNETIIVGQVGNFNENKNQEFSINLIKKINNEYPEKKVCLFLIGDGEKFEEIKDSTKNVKNIICTGRISDVNNYMSIFNILLLPSKYGEGLPVTLIEEQIVNNKCLCLSSDIVTLESNIGNVKYLSLNEIDQWIDAIIYYKAVSNKIDVSKFNIENTAKDWLKMYS